MKKKDISRLNHRAHRHSNNTVPAVSASWDEVKLSKSLKEFDRDLVRFCQRNILRVYPAFFRVNSSNFDPQKAWSVGVQCVALNMQTSKSFMALHRVGFALSNMKLCHNDCDSLFGCLRLNLPTMVVVDMC